MLRAAQHDGLETGRPKSVGESGVSSHLSPFTSQGKQLSARPALPGRRPWWRAASSRRQRVSPWATTVTNCLKLGASQPRRGRAGCRSPYLANMALSHTTAQCRRACTTRRGVLREGSSCAAVGLVSAPETAASNTECRSVDSFGTVTNEREAVRACKPRSAAAAVGGLSVVRQHSAPLVALPCAQGITPTPTPTPASHAALPTFPTFPSFPLLRPTSPLSYTTLPYSQPSLPFPPTPPC